MKHDFAVEDDFSFTREDEDTLRELRSGVTEDDQIDPVTGRKAAQKATLNKRKLSKHEMDEFFMDF